jgi:hypothetical protein
MQGQHDNFPQCHHALIGLLENGARFNSKYSATAPTSRLQMAKGTSGRGGKKQGT